MSSRVTTAWLIDAALLLSGCGTKHAAGESVHGSTRPASATSPAMHLPTSSITCSSVRPRGRFRYSGDHAELAALAAAIGNEVGLQGTFDDVDPNELGVLMERHFIDPAGRTNGSPTMWAFHRFLCDHPDVRASGFTANMGFDGARGPEAIASLETVYASTVDDALRRDARAFCATASEKTMHTHLECFWD